MISQLERQKSQLVTKLSFHYPIMYCERESKLEYLPDWSDKESDDLYGSFTILNIFQPQKFSKSLLGQVGFGAVTSCIRSCFKVGHDH